MIIGLTQRVLLHKGRAYDSIEQSWYSCLKDHKLVIIPNRDDVDIDIDLLIITGGDSNPRRDQVEVKLLNLFLNIKPIIGICHGAFLLTQHLGGKLDTTDNHMDCEHTIVVGNSKKMINSFHTLQIKDPPPNSTTLATDESGHCEAWIKDNVSAIVWHPERMDIPYWPEQIVKFMK